MRLSRNLFSVALASSLLGASAFAAPTTKGTLKLFEPVTVQGKQLAPGQYTVEWNGEGPNVELSIASGKNAVVSVPAHVVPSPKNATSGYSSTKQQDGSSTLTNVFFQGKPFELEIADQAATQGAQPSASGSNQ
jgi:cytoskeletal protein RodZ